LLRNILIFTNSFYFHFCVERQQDWWNGIMFAPMIRGDVLLRLNLKNTVSSTRNKKLLRDDVALRRGGRKDSPSTRYDVLLHVCTHLYKRG
jgi:hypothetical protein